MDLLSKLIQRAEEQNTLELYISLDEYATLLKENPRISEPPRAPTPPIASKTSSYEEGLFSLSYHETISYDRKDPTYLKECEAHEKLMSEYINRIGTILDVTVHVARGILSIKVRQGDK